MTAVDQQLTRHRPSSPGTKPRAVSWLVPDPSRRLPLAAAAVGLGALLAGVEIVAIYAVLALTASQMPACTIVRRWALALLALFGLNAAILTVLAVTSLSWQPKWGVVCYLVVGALLPPGHQARTERSRLASPVDAWAIGAAATVFAMLYRPFVGASTGRAIALLSTNTDSANHLYLVQDIRYFGGYINLRAPVDGWAGMTDYPAAWAGNVALTVQLLLGEEPGFAPFMRLVVPLIIGCYALLVFLSVAVTLEVVRGVTGRSSAATSALTCLCLGLTTVVGVNVFLLQGGFYTQLMATATILASILLLQESDQSGVRRLVIMCLLTVGLMQTWYLLAPVIAAVLLVFAKAARPSWRQLVVAAIPTAALSAYPVLTGPGGSTQINVSGSAPLPTIGGMLALLLVALLGLVLVLRSRGPDYDLRLALVAATVGALLLLVAVLTLQSVTAESRNYYAFKLFYTIFLLGSVAAAGMAGVAFERLRTPGFTLVPPLTVVIIVAGLCLGSISTRSLAWPFVTGFNTPGDGGRALDVLLANYPIGLPSGTDAWIVDGCRRTSDHIATKWIIDLSRGWDVAYRRTFDAFATGSDKPGDLSMLIDRAADPSVKRMELYLHDDCVPSAYAALESRPNVIVIRVP